MDDSTRRNWLITIGQTAVGIGIAGNFALSAATADVSLPPGVYLPSTDQMGHALMSTERFHPLPPDCPTEYIQPRNGPFRPSFFTTSEFPVVQRLTQLFLGEDNPDISDEIAEWVDLRVASAPGVDDAISQLEPSHRVLALAYFGPEQMPGGQKTDGPQVCRNGLTWVANAARLEHGSDFLSLRAEEQVALLESLDVTTVAKDENAGTRFFAFLKGEVIRGFYTSQVGLKELDFKGNAFYARSPGCDLRKSTDL